MNIANFFADISSKSPKLMIIILTPDRIDQKASYRKIITVVIIGIRLPVQVSKRKIKELDRIVGDYALFLESVTCFSHFLPFFLDLEINIRRLQGDQEPILRSRVTTTAL
jgi:hypothetical protein